MMTWISTWVPIYTWGPFLLFQISIKHTQVLWEIGFFGGALRKAVNNKTRETVFRSSSTDFQGTLETFCFFQGQFSFSTIRGIGE